MKKFYCIILALILILLGIVFAFNINAPVNQTTDVIVGFGREVTVIPSGGEPPYSFGQGSCVELLSSTDYEAVYQAQDTYGDCTITFADSASGYGTNYGYVYFNVTCVCNYCTTETDGAMSADDDGISFEEIAAEPDDVEPDDNAQC